MPSLTVTYSEALGSLLHQEKPPIDGIEIGPWYSLGEVEQIQDQFADWDFQFHAGSVITRWQMWPGARRKLDRYLSVAQGKWISIHLELLPWHVYMLSAHLGFHLDPPPVPEAVDHFLETFSRFRESVQLPILLENLPSLPVWKYNYAADPEVISKIVAGTDTTMVLDIAHARIAASYHKQEVKSYLANLPLDRVQQIHVSGVREEHGILQDRHDVMGEIDYELLDWTLGRTAPEVVTLEYFRKQTPLAKQLNRLREILNKRRH